MLLYSNISLAWVLLFLNLEIIWKDTELKFNLLSFFSLEINSVYSDVKESVLKLMYRKMYSIYENKTFDADISFLCT